MARFQFLEIFVKLIIVCSRIDLHLAIATSSSTDFEHAVYIDSVNGEDSQACLEMNSPGVACLSLPWALNASARSNYTKYILAAGTHNLDATIEPFESIHGVSFVGSGSSYRNTTINCTATEGAGLSFNFSANIYFGNLSIIGCSNNVGIHSVWYGSHAALFFSNCSNVTMASIRVGKTPNATGVVMIDTVGNNCITDSLFDENGWRGIHIQLTSMNKPYAMDIAYSIHNTMFVNNSAFKHHSYRSEMSNSCVLFRRANNTRYIFGGGMSLLIQNASGVSFVVSNSKFFHNKAMCGAGLFIAIECKAINNSIHVNGSTFTSNHCPNDNNTISFGGGIRLEHLVESMHIKEMINSSNRMYVGNCNISKNTAFSGGGLSVHSIAQEAGYSSELLQLDMRDSEFRQNEAEVGAAVEFTLLIGMSGGSLPRITVSNSTFVSNKITFHSAQTHKPRAPYQIGIGAVYTNKVPISFKGSVLFENNKGSALAVAGTHVDFSRCVATFYHNTGISGGGLALLGAAGIIIDENTTVNFTSNHASLYGGALYNVYIEKENLVAYSNCFVRHREPFKDPPNWKATFYFKNNYAIVSGSSIYSTSIFPCALGSALRPVENNALCLDNWQYYQNDVEVNCSTEISTEAGYIRFRKETKVNVAPGEVFQLDLDILDDLGRNVSEQTVLTAHTSMSSNFKNASVDPRYNYISTQELAVNGQVGTNLEVHLSTTGQRSWHIHLAVELSDCPPGFSISSVSNSTSNSHCTCSFTGYRFKGTVKCNELLLQSYLLNGYWIGKLKNGSNSSGSNEYVVSLCPSGYCSRDRKSHLKIPKDNLTHLDEVMCLGRNRTGILCGRCLDTYGPAVNSDTFQCVKCEKEKVAAYAIQYVFSVYLPLFILFTCIVIFNVRLTTGPANAFIFYSQIVSSNFNLNADGHIPLDRFTNSPEALTKAYQAPYGLFNLEFIENFLQPFCLGSQLSTLDILQLEYIVAASPLIMIIIVLICFKLRRCCQACAKAAPEQVTSTTKTLLVRLRSGESLLHVFAAFVLLSYTKFGLTSSYILNANPVFNAAGTPVNHQHVYYAGHYSITDSEYIFRYRTPAYIVFIAIVIPPLFLFGYPVIWFEKCLIRIPCLWKLYPADKVQILLDTFQGCYRDKMRFFAGMYFLFRFVINISYILTHNWTQRFMVQQIVCIIFVIIIAVCRPYREEKWIFNYVDLLIFANLGIINTLSLYLYNYTQSNPEQDVPMTAFTLQYILVFLPLLYMTTYVLWALLKKKVLKRLIPKFQKQVGNESESVRVEQNSDIDVQESLGSSLSRCGRSRAATWSEVRIDESTEYSSTKNEDEILFVRAKARNTYKANSSNRKNDRPNSPQAGPTKFIREDTSRPNTTAVSRDSGLHTRGQSCADSVQYSQLTPLVNDDRDSPAHVNYGCTM